MLRKFKRREVYQIIALNWSARSNSDTDNRSSNRSDKACFRQADEREISTLPGLWWSDDEYRLAAEARRVPRSEYEIAFVVGFLAFELRSTGVTGARRQSDR